MWIHCTMKKLAIDRKNLLYNFWKNLRSIDKFQSIFCDRSEKFTVQFMYSEFF